MTRIFSCALAASTLLASFAAVAAPVDFTLDAPTAKSVYLAGEMSGWDKAKIPMERGADGKWHSRVDLASGQWLYKFVVDGKWIADPVGQQNDADGQGGRHSFVFVGDGDWAAHAGVARGRVETTEFASPAWAHPVKLNVYLPPAFRKGKAYPVLVLLHGSGMDADQWFKTGQVNHFMDNLIAQDLIKPFVIVMPSSGTTPYTDASERMITDELPAWLKIRYGLNLKAAQAGVAGMSMGGFGAYHLALSHPERFGFAFALSSGYIDRALASLKDAPQRLPFKLLLLCGTEDSFIEGNRAFARALQQRGSAFYYREDEGGHDFHYWNHRTTEMLLAADAYFLRNYARHNEDEVKIPAAESLAAHGKPVAVDDALWAKLPGHWVGEWIFADNSMRGRFEQTITEAKPGHYEGRFSVFDAGPNSVSDVAFSATTTAGDCKGCILSRDTQGDTVTETISEQDGQLWRQWTSRHGEYTIISRLRKEN